MGRFYPNDAPTPARLPKYLVVVATGAYGFDRPEDALDAARQLTTNGRPARAMMRP